jgi:hypothetical protein
MELTMRPLMAFLILTCFHIPAHGDDMDDPLAELAGLGDAIAATAPEGGGSIRAKRDASSDLLTRLQDNNNLQAKVEEVKNGKFPAVALRIKVIKAPAKGKVAAAAKDATLVVVPAMKVSDGRVDMADDATRINAGAYYLREGDRVMVRLGKQKGNMWEAEYIERK